MFKPRYVLPDCFLLNLRFEFTNRKFIGYHGSKELDLKHQQEGSHDQDYKQAVKQAVPLGMKSLGTKRGHGDEGRGGAKRQKTGANTNTGGGGGGDGEFILVGSPTYFYLQSNSRTKYKYRNGRRSSLALCSGRTVTRYLIPVSSRMVVRWNLSVIYVR
jgi:hypothetical protein